MSSQQIGFGEVLLPRVLEGLPALHRGEGWALLRGDCREILRLLPSESADLVFADPPYFLSNGGSTCSGGERVAVDKGEWDESHGLLADHAFHREWLEAVRRVLKPSGTMFVSGTHHCIFSIGWAMQSLGWNVLNAITWFKPNASPNLGCRQFTHSTELVLWAAPAAYDPLIHTFNDALMRKVYGKGKQVRDMWQLSVTPAREKLEGDHPTQKPLDLLHRIVTAASLPGQLIVDPFNGSGTTGVAAVGCGRRYIGIDVNADYLDLTRRRICAGKHLAKNS